MAEGSLVVRQLLRSRYRVRSVLATEKGLRALGADLALVGAPVYLVSQPLVESVTGFHFHRGVLASADRAPMLPLAKVVAGCRLILVVEGVNDAENLGSLFRNAAAFGAGAVVLDPTSADPLYRRTVRVSMGHVLRVPFARAEAWPGALGDLRGLGFELLALTPGASAGDIRSVRPDPGLQRAVLVGSEGAGLSAAALSAADRRIRIAMVAGVDSLNVATATAVALHYLAPWL